MWGQEGMAMENIIKSLFEYQRFDNNPELQSIIDDTLQRYEGVELCDDDMTYVNAAGEFEIKRFKVIKK